MLDGYQSHHNKCIQRYLSRLLPGRDYGCGSGALRMHGIKVANRLPGGGSRPCSGVVVPAAAQGLHQAYSSRAADLRKLLLIGEVKAAHTLD